MLASALLRPNLWLPSHSTALGSNQVAAAHLSVVERHINRTDRSRFRSEQVLSAADSVYDDSALTHDYKGRPRMVSSQQGMVAADQGDCSAMGAQIAVAPLCVLLCLCPCLSVHMCLCVQQLRLRAFQKRWPALLQAVCSGITSSDDTSSSAMQVSAFLSTAVVSNTS